MKRLIILFLWLAPLQSFGQVTTVFTNIYGDIEIEVKCDGAYVLVDVYGEILDLYGHRGKIPRIEYHDDFWDYNAGKLKSIGSVEFEYYNDFWDYKARKLKSIGTVKLDYYSDFWDYEAAKIKNIGAITFSYHSDFWDYEAAKIKSIGNHQFKYYSSGYEKGELQSGNELFVVSGVEVIVRTKRWRRRQ